MTRAIEEQILRATVEALLGIPGVTNLRVCYEDDHEAAMQIDPDTPFEEIAAEAFACDGATLRLTLPVGHEGFAKPTASMVWFIWSNGNDGLDCITDYGVSLGEALKPVTAMVEELERAKGYAK